MNPRTSKVLRILGWTVLLTVLPTAIVLFWAPVGLATLIAIPIVGIFFVLRSLVQDLRGLRPEDTYRAGRAGFGHIPVKPSRFRYFSGGSTTSERNDDVP